MKLETDLFFSVKNISNFVRGEFTTIGILIKLFSCLFLLRQLITKLSITECILMILSEKIISSCEDAFHSMNHILYSGIQLIQELFV